MGELEVQCGDASAELRERVFSRLRPYCLELLDFTRNPRKNASFLTEMADFLRRAPPAGLQPLLEYTLFPLLLLLDAAVHCRSGKKADSSGCCVSSDSSLNVHIVSDSVAEDTLRCLEELLRKCPLGSVNQMSMVMKKLTSAALLSASEVSEEFRVGIIRCLKAMLLMLQPCSVESCSCKELFLLPTMISTLQDCLPSAFWYEEPKECLLAFLRSKDASIAVGHWLSLLLQVGEVEAARGQRGSVNLRKEAFLTLRVLVAKVGTADALAFFLPGITSRFSKALLVTKNMISGAAGNAGTVEHAIFGLSEFLIIVLRDEANHSALQTSTNVIKSIYSDKNTLTQTVLDALRRLPTSHHDCSENSICQSAELIPSKDDKKEKLHDNYFERKSLYVQRTKEWIDQTSANVNKLLSATFPHLCIHPSEKVRTAVVDGSIGLLSNCSCTLEKSKLMLLECLCALAVDDSDVVSTAAQNSLNFLFMPSRNVLRETEFSELFTRFVERLPKVIIGGEEAVAISYARRLLALMYYAGPKLVADHNFCSPMKAASFLDVLMLAFGHSSQFAGSIDKLISSKPLPIGYLLSVAELKAGSLSRDADLGINDASLPLISEMSSRTTENIPHDYHLPRMPPWFVNVGSQKLYVALAGILRLLGLSILSGDRVDLSLLPFIDNLLERPRKLISDIRLKGQNKQSWQYWYSQGGLGQLMRQTSVAICMINEIIYGLADHSVSSCMKVFRNAEREAKVAQAMACCNDLPTCSKYRLPWKFHEVKDAKEHLIHCVGSILHEYTSAELWDLPVDQNSHQLEHDPEENMSLHFFRDSRILHQVMIEGIGVFSTVLGNNFIQSGFMHSTLYLLLQNLICSVDLIRTAADAALHIVSTSTGHSTVGHLVVANADYIIDSLCQELRHLDLNSHVPDVLAAMLSYIGAAKEILPLLEEPVLYISRFSFVNNQLASFCLRSAASILVFLIMKLSRCGLFHQSWRSLADISVLISQFHF
ncbi:hypothetical protein AXF42_Ash018609 [Apostasia shenzhenica]|uniref:TTI1 N-terminal TPR domain-containing protein n=1 Tax=Apostasia shenzhenica TaxID=1088818 RepID=A0A2I0B1F8_9ASPA|nr:hypothetical protein AXF42_Ash018609 [Apostasia shenzhenica]